MSVGCKIIRDFERPAPELVARFKGMPVANIDDNMGRIAAVDTAIEPIGYKGQLRDKYLMNHLQPGASFMSEYVIRIGEKLAE